MFWSRKEKIKPFEKELEVLDKLLKTSKMQTSTFCADLTFTFNFSTSYSSTSKIVFSYNAIYKEFHGSLQFWLENELFGIPHSYGSMQVDKLYWPAINMVKKYFDLETPCKEFQKAWEQQKIDQKAKEQSLLDKYSKEN